MSTYAEIIEKTVYLTIATVDEAGQPWNTPVYGAYDASGAFYWGSDRNSQHSRNITKNPKVFIVIYDSTAPAGSGDGAYIKAVAQQLIDPQEVAEARALIQGRRSIPYWKLEEVQPSSPVQLYKAMPVSKWLNDESSVDNVYVDVRKEVEV